MKSVIFLGSSNTFGVGLHTFKDDYLSIDGVKKLTWPYYQSYEDDQFIKSVRWSNIVSNYLNLEEINIAEAGGSPAESLYRLQNLDLTNTRAFKTWLYGIWQSIFFVAPHVHISTISTKTLKSGKGTIKSICVNIKSTGSSVCNVYDALSVTGTPIISLDTDTNYGEITYNLDFSTGLTVDIVGGTAADLLFVFN